MAGPVPRRRARHRRRRPRGRLIATGLGAAILLAAVVVGLVLALGGRPSATPPSTTTTTAPAVTTTTKAPPHSTSTTAPARTTTTVPASTTTSAPTNLVSPSSVLVEVTNGYGAKGAAAAAASALHTAGFTINGTGDAASFTAVDSIIQYAPGELAAAQTLDDHIEGPVQLQQVTDLPATNEVVLILGSTYRGVAA